MVIFIIQYTKGVANKWRAMGKKEQKSIGQRVDKWQGMVIMVIHAIKHKLNGSLVGSNAGLIVSS